jgi:hypothetical protein
VQRPKEVKFAVLFAGIAIATRVGSTLLQREQLGDGWIIFASFSVFLALIYAVLLVLSYNGSSWVRYAYAVLFALGLLAFRGASVRILLDVWVMASLVASVVAISLWFSRRSNEWYKQAHRVGSPQSDA